MPSGSGAGSKLGARQMPSWSQQAEEAKRNVCTNYSHEGELIPLIVYRATGSHVSNALCEIYIQEVLTL